MFQFIMFIFLVVWFVIGISTSSARKKQASARPRQPVPTVEPVIDPGESEEDEDLPAAQGDCDHEDHQPRELTETAPSLSADQVREPYQGSLQITELTEGVDPCHDDMQPLGIEDMPAGEASGWTPDLTPNALVNAFVMQEVLKRPGT